MQKICYNPFLSLKWRIARRQYIASYRANGDYFVIPSGVEGYQIPGTQVTHSGPYELRSYTLRPRSG